MVSDGALVIRRYNLPAVLQNTLSAGSAAQTEEAEEGGREGKKEGGKEGKKEGRTEGRKEGRKEAASSCSELTAEPADDSLRFLQNIKHWTKEEDG